MRVLITTTGGAGHFGPLVPFAEAIGHAGGEVLVATRASTAVPILAHGYEVATFADAPAEERDAVFGAARELPIDDANVRVVADVFARIDARAAVPGVLAACESFRPDVIVHEVCEFAGALVGAHTGVPVVSVGIGLAALERLVMPAAEAALDDVRGELGLDAGESAAYFTLTPPLLEDPAAPGPPGAQRFRERDDRATGRLPDWWDGADGPLVYLTFGSVAPQLDFFPGLYQAAIDALAPLPVRVLVTTGRDRDPADLGPLPPNVEIHTWIPHLVVLEHVSVFVTQGGTGSLMEAFYQGVPVVVAPQQTDQLAIARQVEALGLGRSLGTGDLDAPALRAAVEAVAADGETRRRAAAMRDSLRTAPGPAGVADRIESLMSGTA